MSTITYTPPLHAAPTNRINHLKGEWTKLRTLPSTWRTAALAAALAIGFTGAVDLQQVNLTAQQRHNFDPASASLFGVLIAATLLGALAVRTIAAEYSTGMIRTTLMTNPHRGVMIAAKGVVFAVVALVTSLVTAFAAFFVGQTLMSSDHISTTIGSPNVLRAVIGGALFLTACGVLAFGLGLLLRHSAGGIGATVGLLFVVTILVNFLPQSWQNHVDKWIPALAGGQVWMARALPPGNTPMYGPWPSFAILCGYAALAVAAGVIFFRKRDA